MNPTGCNSLLNEIWQAFTTLCHQTLGDNATQVKHFARFKQGMNLCYHHDSKHVDTCNKNNSHLACALEFQAL